MAEMGWFGRTMVNLRTVGRASRLLQQVEGTLPLPKGARVLELGAGGGGLAALVHERFHPSCYVGTDFDPDQVNAARKFLTARYGAIPPSIELRQADAVSLPFPDASFECVFAILMLHHVEAQHGEYVRRPLALREIRRVLSPGGLFVYSDFSERERLKGSLAELGFSPVHVRARWRHEVGVFRAPNPSGVSPGTPG